MIQAAARRRMMWFDMSRQSAGGTADGGCIGHASPAITDRTRSHCADRDRAAHPSINPKPNTPVPMSAVGGGGCANGNPSPKNSQPNGLKAFQHLST